MKGRFQMTGWVAAALMLLAAAVPAAPLDDEFLAARDAFRARHAGRLEAEARRLKGHLLEPYVAYWRLALRLESAAPEEVQAFLDAHADTPLSDQLRSEWLKLLGKRGEWDLFDAELPRLARDDIEITCYALQSRLRHDPDGTLPEARPLWFVARDMPESCSPLFDALFAAGMLSEEDLWMRIRLALERGRVTLARAIAERLPPAERLDRRVLQSIAANPRAYLERRRSAAPRTRPQREALLFAVHRLARIVPAQAADYWAQLEARFPPADRAYAWGMIAYLGALRHEPQALEWYRRAGDLSDLQLAWKARAALRAGEWEDVLEAIDTMTRRESSQPAWRYWRARALKALGQAAEAEALFKGLATEYHFYGQLALEELGGRITAPEPAYRPSSEEVEAMARHPGLRRALALYRLRMRTEAAREWNWAIRGFDDRQLLAAAELARRHEVYDRAIYTAERTVALHDFELRYLAPYRDVLKIHTAQLELDEAWVYGLIRQESRFITEARSRAGASGLMQLMPGTARWVARQLGLRNWRWSKVNEIETNVSLGTYYLRYVLDRLDGHPVLASAAYNAGPTRARAWQPADAELEGAVYAETIPFSETRHYVQHVMANTSYYAHNLHRYVESLKRRMGIVGPPREDAASLEDTP